MLLVIDTDDWLTAFNTIEEAEDHLEWQDVVSDEYRVCGENGKLFRFDVGEYDFHIIPTGEVDAGIPVFWFLVYAARHGIKEEDALRILSESPDYGWAIKRVSREGRWRRKRQ